MIAVTYIQLEDIARKFKKPCIADLKMGAITYDPEASEAKKMRELAKYEYLHKLGFQIRGMRVCFAFTCDSQRFRYYWVVVHPMHRYRTWYSVTLTHSCDFEKDTEGL